MGFWQNIFLSGASTLLVVIQISVEETQDDYHLYELDRLPGVERVEAGEVHRLLYDGLVPAEGVGSGGTWHVAGGHL